MIGGYKPYSARSPQSQTLQALMLVAAFVFFISFQANAQDFTSNLVGHWQLNESGNTDTAVDSGSGGNNGTLTNFPADESANWIAGQAGNALDFDGSDDYIDFGDIGIVEGNAQQTFAFWVKLSATELGNDGTLFSKGAFADNQPILIWRDELAFAGAYNNSGNTDTIGVIFNDGTDNIRTAGSTNFLNDTNWNHIVVTFEADTANGLKIYKNGTLDTQVSTTNVDFIANTGSELFVGRSGSNNNPLEGILDDIRIYDRALTSADVTALYASYSSSSFVGPQACNAAYEAVMWYNDAENVLQYCDGTNWVDMGPASTGGAGTCSNPDGVRGEVGYNFTRGVMQYCNGANWIAMGPITEGSPSSSIPTTGLTHHYALDETGNTSTAIDSAGSNNGTLTNFPADPTANWVTGANNGALDFDGSNDYITANSGSFNPSTSDFTLSMWAYAHANDLESGNSRAMFSQADGSGTGRTWLYIHNTDGNVKQFLDGVAGDSGHTLSLNTWTHIAMVHDDSANTITWYINGNASNVNTSLTPDSADGNFQFGVNKTLASGRFDGLLDDIRLYNTALSESDISSLYEGSGGGGGFDVCAAANSPTPGTVCADGTIYAGLSPDGDVPMFTTRCDQGMSWNGTSCSGTRGGFSWDNGALYSTGVTDQNDGDGNTTTLAGLGARFEGATECSNLTAHGHSDWYQPANLEFAVLCTNKNAIGGFGTSNPDFIYYTSSEIAAFQAYTRRTSDCANVGGGKGGSYSLRCVRKGSAAPSGGLCSSPDGVVGEIIYNDDQNIMQYCNGAEWIGIR